MSLLSHKQPGMKSSDLFSAYMRQIKEKTMLLRSRTMPERQTLELIWEPGSVQVDFGEADSIKAVDEVYGHELHRQLFV